MTEQEALDLLNNHKQICNFYFFRSGFTADLDSNGDYQKRWLWHDSDNLIWIDFKEAMAILDMMNYAPAHMTDITPIHKWLYLYLRKRSAFDFNNLRDVLFSEIDRLVSYFIREWFRFNPEGRHWGICIPDQHFPQPGTKYEDLDRFYQDHDFLQSYFSLDVWRDVIMNYQVPAFTTEKELEYQRTIQKLQERIRELEAKVMALSVSRTENHFHDQSQSIDNSKNVNISSNG